MKPDNNKWISWLHIELDALLQVLAERVQKECLSDLVVLGVMGVEFGVQLGTFVSDPLRRET